MDKENVKRSFNNTAEFFLCLTIFIMVMTIVNCFLKISSYKGLGFSISDDYIAEIIVDILIIVAAVFTLMKKKAGLIALIGLFLLRTLAPLLSNTDISTAYLLGGKIGTLIRDVGPFAIAMCFKKNGISGWKSMLASEEYVAKHTVIPEEENSIPPKEGESQEGESVEQTQPSSDVNNLSAEVVSPMTNDVVVGAHEQESTENAAMNETVARELENPTRQKKEESKLKTLSKGAKIGMISALCIILALLISASVVALKSYPDYISSYRDKWNYSFNLPNDKLANSLYDDYESKQLSGLMFFDVEDGAAVATSYFYDNEKRVLNDYYNGSNSYLVIDTVRSTADIDSTSFYTARWSNDYDWSSVIKGGERVLTSYQRLIKDDPNLVCLKLTPIDLSSYLNEQEQRIETITSIPTRDLPLIKKMIAHYVKKENYNRALDVIQFYLDYNKKNAELIGFTGFLHYMTQDLEEADEFATRALSIDSKDLYGNLVKGCVAAEKNDWTEAARWSKKAIDYGSEVCEPYYTYGESLYQKGETKQAREYYSKGYNKQPDSPLAERYKHCGGLPFDFVSLSFALGKANGSIITDYGEKLYSSKSQYIMPKVKVNVVRVGNWDIQCKLYCRGSLQTGTGSSDGYTYDFVLFTYKTGPYEQNIGGWGNSTPGNWPAGNYKFELWYDGEKVGEDWFTMY